MTDLFSNPDESGNANASPTHGEPSSPEVKQDNVDVTSLYADQLSSIVTDDGRQKYSDVATALASIPHAQSHIASLTQEVAQLKSELDKRKGAEDLLATLQTQSDQPQAATPASPVIDETMVQQVVQQQLSLTAQQQQEANNASQVKQFLENSFKDKASEVFADKATELGMTKEALTMLAKQSPKAVLAYFHNSKAPDPQPTTTSYRTPGLPTEEPEVDFKSRFSGAQSEQSKKWEQAKRAVANRT